MSREIKFRGMHMHMLPQNKHLDGTWYYGYLCGNGCYIEPKDGIEKLIDLETVGQYTGFKDKNNVEIYEGDVVVFTDVRQTESGYSEGECIGIVCWDEETASFQVTERLSAESHEILGECVVVGNIYENKNDKNMKLLR